MGNFLKNPRFSKGTRELPEHRDSLRSGPEVAGGSNPARATKASQARGLSPMRESLLSDDGRQDGVWVGVLVRSRMGFRDMGGVQTRVL
jgi:hypothetical protein